MKPILSAAIGAVIGFGLGIVTAVFGGTWLLSYLGVGPFSNESYIAQRIRETEEKFGFKCAEVHSTTYRFINEEMGKLIDATREGKPWLTEGRDEFSRRVADLRDRTKKCRMLQFEARAGKLPFSGNFDGHDQFLMSLDAFVSASAKAAPNDPIVKAHLLGRLEKEYRDLTAASTPTRDKSSRAGDAGR